MIHRVIKSDSYHGDKEPLADLGLSRSPYDRNERRRIRKIEVSRYPNLAKPTLIETEVEQLCDSPQLFLTTKAAREVAKGLLQNMTVEEVVADAELVGILRAMLSDVNTFGRTPAAAKTV